MENLYSICTTILVISVGYILHVKGYPMDAATYPTHCGIVHRRNSRIINGTVSDDLHFPSIASIKRNGVHVCGGIIISSRYVLSAAHCSLQPHDSWTVTLGEYNLAENETFSASYGIDEVIVHEDYGKLGLLDNDIVLLKLSDDIEWTNHIQPICLPKENLLTSRDATAVGWGFDLFTAFTDTNSNDKLRSVKIDIFENNICNDIYAQRHLRFQLKKTQMCAGKLDGEVRDTNSGDSGGPLLVEHQGRQVLVGITSGSPPESIYPRSPGVYTRVFEYMDWIMSKIHQVQYYPSITNKV